MQLHFVNYCWISDSVSYPVESAFKVYISSTVCRIAHYNTHRLAITSLNIAKWITARFFRYVFWVSLGLLYSMLFLAFFPMHTFIFFLASYRWICFCSSFYSCARLELTKGSTDNWQNGWKNTHNHKIIKNCATEQCVSVSLAKGILVWSDMWKDKKDTYPTLKIINVQV